MDVEVEGGSCGQKLPQSKYLSNPTQPNPAIPSPYSLPSFYHKDPTPDTSSTAFTHILSSHFAHESHYHYTYPLPLFMGVLLIRLHFGDSPPSHLSRYRQHGPIRSHPMLECGESAIWPSLKSGTHPQPPPPNGLNFDGEVNI